MKIWLDGQFYEKEQAKVSVFDHGLLYGDGIFEGIRVYNGCVFRLKHHIDRLWEGAKVILLNISMTKEEMIEAVRATVRENNLRDAYIRLVITRGVGDLGLDPKKCSKPTIFIIASSITLYPKELYEIGMEIATVPTQRFNVGSWNARVKSLNYMNNIMAKIEGHLYGVPEVLMLDHNGYVVECSADNFFIVKNGELFVPPQFLGALRGITRDAILDLAKKRGINIREEPFTRFEVWTADEAFMSGTAAEVVPVVKVDSREIGDGKPGPVTKMLIEDFKKIVEKDGVMAY